MNNTIPFLMVSYRNFQTPDGRYNTSSFLNAKEPLSVARTLYASPLISTLFSLSQIHNMQSALTLVLLRRHSIRTRRRTWTCMQRFLVRPPAQQCPKLYARKNINHRTVCQVNIPVQSTKKAQSAIPQLKICINIMQTNLIQISRRYHTSFS